MNRTRSINRSAAALWASAFVIAAFIIVQAGRLPANEAYAEMTSAAAGYTLLTTNAGRGLESGLPFELLYVVDNRAETILVYEIENAQNNRIVLRDGGPLPNLFTAAN